MHNKLQINIQPLEFLRNEQLKIRSNYDIIREDK